jgi:TldD protein
MKPNGSCPWASILEVSAGEKADLLLSIIASARRSTARIFVQPRFRRPAKSDSSPIVLAAAFIKRARASRHFQATAIDRASAVSRRATAWRRRAGPAGTMSSALADQGRAGRRGGAREAGAKPITPGDCDVVIDPTDLWLTIHETVGHSTELDRVLGWEANFAGTSFVKPHMLNELRFGSG